ncbi:MAG: methyltransferase domain-containing protein, partial [Candidatus Obscuribacterales bacterium]|nr:methyltransferase domain-containing protein [Candidatus Obscuribacterales bacterium]
VDPSLLFREYNFRTVSSPSLVEHFLRFVADTIAFVECPKGSLVVEIGSNDGTLMKLFKEKGMVPLGIDPARNIAEEANQERLETIPEFFTRKLALEIKEKKGLAHIICANNVYAHIDDMDDVTSGVKALLAPDGVFVFEVSYLVDTVENRVFETIYHEHVSYHSVKPFVQFFKRHGLELVHVERISPKGGSIRGYVMHEGAKDVSSSVNELVALEKSLNLSDVETYKEFGQYLDGIRSELHALLTDLKGRGSTIAGFGASITVTTLIYHFELGSFIDYLVDDNPAKEGLFSPGHHIPVLHSKALYEKKPDYTIVLAYSYWDSIRKKHEAYVTGGGRFIVPLPKVVLVP